MIFVLVFFGGASTLVRAEMDSDEEIFLTQNTFSQEPFSPELNLEELLADFREVRELRAQISILPTAQSKYLEMYKGTTLDWKEIYILPFRVALGTKTREFQYKIFNRYLVANVLLNKNWH